MPRKVLFRETAMLTLILAIALLWGVSIAHAIVGERVRRF